MNDSIKLTGLDASNPLGFLAALGVLQSLTDSEAGTEIPWRLSWQESGRWTAVLHGSNSINEVIGRLLAEKKLWAGEPALELAYDDNGQRLSASAAKATFDLKPAPEAFRSYIDEVASRTRPSNLRSVRMVAAYGSELAKANKGDLKPTALHFTAGQQCFLTMVRALQEGVTADDFREALIGPWQNVSKLPSLSWNAAAPRVYAYRADNPAGEKRGSVPAADWLAFIGLRFFPVASQGSELKTASVRGGWKDSSMRWPVWTAPMTVHAVRSLLLWQGLHRSTYRTEASALGIAAVYESRILRSDQGGYGSFSPASVQ